VKIFDEDKLVTDISSISGKGIAAFACSCAERSFGILNEFFGDSGSEKIIFLRQNLNALWKAILDDIPLSWSEELTEEILALTPEATPEIFPYWFVGVDDAIASICYAAFAINTGKAENAGWAAQSAYNMTFYAAEDKTTNTSLDFINSATVVQLELDRQASDLDILLKADELATYRELKERSETVDKLSELRNATFPIV
jgi:hypothetical protein